MSCGLRNTRWMASVISTAPRFEPRWPLPRAFTVSTMNSRISPASWWSCDSSSRARPAGELIVSRMVWRSSSIGASTLPRVPGGVRLHPAGCGRGHPGGAGPAEAAPREARGAGQAGRHEDEVDEQAEPDRTGVADPERPEEE